MNTSHSKLLSAFYLPLPVTAVLFCALAVSSCKRERPYDSLPKMPESRSGAEIAAEAGQKAQEQMRQQQAKADSDKSFDELISSLPEWALSQKAEESAKAENYERAIKYYNAILKANPNRVEVLRLRGIAKSKLNDHQGSIDDYTKILTLDPRDANALSLRAGAKHRLGDDDGAIEDLSKALEIDPNNENVKSLLQGLTKARDQKGGSPSK